MCNIKKLFNFLIYSIINSLIRYFSLYYKELYSRILKYKLKDSINTPHEHSNNVIIVVSWLHPLQAPPR